ncbi:MAG: cell division protein FtsX [Nitrospiria bacterium]
MATAYYFIKEFIYNLNRHRLLTLGAVFISAFIWVVLGFFVVVYFNLFELYSSLKNDIKVTVYLQDGLNAGDIKTLEERLSTEREVLTVDYISKDQALTGFRKTLESRDDLFKNFEGNPLPSYFEIKLKDLYQSPEDYARFTDKIKGNKGIEDVFYGKEWVDLLNRYVGFIQILGIAIGFILTIGMISMIGIILRLTVYSKREEIQVLKYIGATNWFIKVPLLMEGAFLGLMSSGLSLLALYGIFYYLIVSSHFNNLFIGAPFKPAFLSLDDMMIFLLSGPFLGVMGSIFPLRRYLKSFN